MASDDPVWNLSSLMAMLPESQSPSPICSTASGSCPPAPSEPYSTAPTNHLKSLCDVSAMEVNEWIEEHAKKYRYPSNFDRKRLKREPPDLASHKPNTPVVSEAETKTKQNHNSIMSSTMGKGKPVLHIEPKEDSFYAEKAISISRPKPYHEFLHEFEKQKLEAEKDGSRKTKFLQLIHKVQQKKKLLNLWESKQIGKAMTKMAKFEKKLHRKRMRESERTWKKIYLIKEKAEQEKLKVRRLIKEDLAIGQPVYI